MATGNETATTAPMVVIIVEDNPLARSSLERVVARDHTALVCSTYEQAVQALESLTEPPGALIVDVNLGGDMRGDGIDVAKRARERFGGYIPTLVLTGGVHPDVTERTQELRGEFLVKPQTAEAVRVFLERATIEHAWGVPHVLDLERAVNEFATAHGLTNRQRKLLYTMMRAAERGERPDLNRNTRKAGMRRILAKTGHAGFDEIRTAIKQRARRGSTT